MHRFLVSVLALVAVPPAIGRSVPTPTATELKKAIELHSHVHLGVTDVKAVSCRVIEEEPTEFDCSWRQRSGSSWRKYRTYFAIDGKQGWTIVDWPPANVR